MASLKIPLVDYSDSDSDSDTPQAPPAKVSKTSSSSTPTPASSGLPPLPSRFHDLYAVAPRVGQQDDPSLHGGRKRSIPHIQGNWPTHVFIESDGESGGHLSRSEFDCLDDIYAIAAAIAADDGISLESHLTSDLGSELPLHLSLSRPNVLTTAQREGFMELLGDRVEKIRIKPFVITLAFAIEFTGWEWVSNFDQTRWFFVLKASKGPENELPRLLQLTNRTFEAFGQPALYSQGGDRLDGFHVSLAWCLEKPSKQTLQKTQEKLMGKDGCGKKVITLRGGPQQLAMNVETIKIKIGNSVNAIELKKEKGEEGGSSKRRRFS